ncbi:hypothetical protein KC367_g8931 [Hortaea werneckii]|nr:hypothetical protein KC357_g8925 [Hortaea werneckii]KAI7492929.1 hypothetical protein KC367_g8931 [Hortaea werneckii]
MSAPLRRAYHASRQTTDCAPQELDTKPTAKAQDMSLPMDDLKDLDGVQQTRDKDDRTIPLPQPSDSQDDPLNWTWAKKHRILLSLILAALLTDFGMTYGFVLFQAQAPDFHMSVTSASRSASGGLFLQGPAGIFAVPLIQRYGRLPVLFWSQFVSALMVLAAALSPNYACFTAFRALQGWFNTAPQVVGLSVIHDLFPLRERTSRVNIWVFCLLGGPFLGPFLAAWLIQAVDWRTDFGVLAGLHGLATLSIIFLGDETLYDRRDPPPPRDKGVIAKLKLLTGMTGIMSTLKPQIFFITVVYVMVMIAWVIGVNNTVSQLLLPAPYRFSGSAFACSWLAPLIGAVVGQLWGYWFNKWLFNRYVRRHNGRHNPVNRLWGTYAPTAVGLVGLVLYGQAFQHSLHWILIEIGWACMGFMMVSATTAVSAYCLDCFPEEASLVASIINMWRTTGGFCVAYFQMSWIRATGADVAFGLQALILGVAFVVGVVTTQVLGIRLRATADVQVVRMNGSQ